LSAAGLAAALVLLKGQPNIEVRANLLDADPMMLGLGNGKGYDLRRRTVFDLKPDHLITKSIGCAYDPEAQCPLWEQFLAEVFEKHCDLVEYLQCWAGYCLTGMITEQQALFAFGIGANGKSVLFSVLAEMFGSYAVSAPVETFMLSAGEGPKLYLLARLAGARFVLANETADGQRLAENTIKELTGGERIAAAHKYGHVFQYQPQFKIAIVGNHKPSIRGTDTGIWRRLHLLPFNRTFELAEQDTQLVFKLKAELSGILNWALRGLVLWQKRGRLLVPEVMGAELATYRSDSDVIGQWLNEQCETGDTLEATAASLYQSYKHWCDSNGHKASSQTMLGRRLSERGFTKKSGARIVWQGLAVRPLF
jgi:putative DNA primase/helicase